MCPNHYIRQYYSYTIFQCRICQYPIKQYLGAIPSLEKQDRPKPKTRSKTQLKMGNENVVTIETQSSDDANITGSLMAYEPTLANVKRSNKVSKPLNMYTNKTTSNIRKISYEVMLHMCISILISERNK